MKKQLSFLIVLLIVAHAFNALAATGRSSTARQWINAPRATTVNNDTIARQTVEQEAADLVTDELDLEAINLLKQACVNNNIGIGNTFVWAAKDSDTSDYSTMIEDTENLANNTCFVKVDLSSSDSDVDVSDIEPVYYEMNQSIVCGSWTDSDKIKKRILDAKKSTRTWGAIAGAVGGAGIGVGAMELFGNKLVANNFSKLDKVQGQESLSDSDLKKSKINVLYKENYKQYEDFQQFLFDLKEECEKEIWDADGAPPKPDVCNSNSIYYIDYDAWLNAYY